MSYVVCPQCGRQITTTEAPEQPTACPACGARLVDERDDSATRPVEIDAMATAPVPVGAALTSGAAGGEVGDDAGDDAGAGRMVTRDLPVSALPVPPAETAGRRWRAASIVSAGAALVALLALAAALALLANGGLAVGPFAPSGGQPTLTVPAATATPTVTTITTAGLYTVSYPNSWMRTQNNHNAPDSYYSLLTDPHTGASVNITAQRVVAPIDAAALDRTNLRYLVVAGTKLASETTPQAVMLSGATWTKVEADVTLRTQDGGSLYAHAVALTTNFKGYAYTIVYLAPTPDQAATGSMFASANTRYFQPLLATFQLLG